MSFIRHVCAAAVLAVPLFVASAASPSIEAASASASPPEQQVAGMVNAFRAAHGKAPLTLDEGMSADSRRWSGHMAAGGLAHDPNYGRSCDRVGQHSQCAENVGYSQDAGAVQANFQGSPGHRRNLLCDCTHMGIGVVRSGGNVFVTQRFAAAAHAGQTAAAVSASPSVAEPPRHVQVESARSYVRAAYADFAGRSPSSSDLRHWAPRLGSPADRAVLVRALAYSDEALGSVIDGYYDDALGRPADDAGRAHWSDLIQRRLATPADVAARLYSSTERFRDDGGDLAAWVDGLYRSLLDRPADDAGRAHWAAVAERHGRTVVSRSLYDSPESVRVRVDDAYEHLLGRPVDPAGLGRWTRFLHRSGNDVDLTRSLATSAEYVARAAERF